MISITNISKRMMKGCLMLMLFLAQSAVSFAEVKLYLEDFTISSGETKEVSLVLDNDEDATQMQARFNLPSGLLFVEGSATKTSRVKGRGATVQTSTETGNLVIVVTDGTVAAGSGAVVTFQVQATPILAEGDHDIDLFDIVVSDSNGDQLNTEEEYTATVTMSGLSSCKFTAPESFEIFANQEYQVDVTLSNEGVTNLAAFEGKLALPEGLEIVPGEDGMFIYTDRLPAPLEFKFKIYDDYTSFVLSSSNNTKIVGTNGVIFSFMVKAAASLAANSEIKLSDLRIATVDGTSRVVNEEISIQVTNTSETAWEALQEQLDELKQQLDEAIAATEGISDEGVTNAVEAANTAYATLSESMTAAHEAGTLNEFDFETASQPTVDAIAAVADAVEQVAIAANIAQNEKDLAAIADAQQTLDDVKAAIAEMDEDVQASVAETIATAQQGIDDAAAAVDASFKAGTAVADAETNAAAIAAAKATAEKALADAKAAQQSVDPVEYADTPLTPDMFKGWDGVGADAQVIKENPAQENVEFGTQFSPGNTIYGSGSVFCTSFADVTGVKTLRINAAEGMQFRVLINRKAVGDGGGDSNGGALIELNPVVPAGATYVDVDLSEYEFVHINAIKVNWGSPAGVVESLILNPSENIPVAIDGVNGEKAKAAAARKYMENGRVVIYRNGKKFSLAGTQLQ